MGSGSDWHTTFFRPQKLPPLSLLQESNAVGVKSNLMPTLTYCRQFKQTRTMEQPHFFGVSSLYAGVSVTCAPDAPPCFVSWSGKLKAEDALDDVQLKQRPEGLGIYISRRMNVRIDVERTAFVCSTGPSINSPHKLSSHKHDVMNEII